MSLTNRQKNIIKKKYRTLKVNKISRLINASEKEVSAYIKSLSKSQITPNRVWLFRIVLISVPILFVLFLEIGLRLFNYDGKLALFIQAPGDYSKYMMCNPWVGRRFFFMQPTVPDPPNDLFLRKKPDNCYRIFVLGGSTTAGYPYGNNLMFSRILNKRLNDTFPKKRIEVVNTAMTAINTYSLLDYMPEILKYKPDAILIYSGHNEFYGALGIASNESLGKYRPIIKAYLKLQHFKIFLLIRNLIGSARRLFNSSLSKPTATLMERIVAKQTIPYESHLYKLGRKQFKKNLEEIISMSLKAHVPVILSELVSNIKDQKPFISVQTKSLPKAESVFFKANNEFRRGDYLAAKKDYYRAKDLDALRFRATEDFNNIVHNLGQKFNIPVVPMREYFEKRSEHNIIGKNLMLDQLHPNVKGYFTMADAFYDTMEKNGFIQKNWNTSLIKSSNYYENNWGFTSLDTAYANLRIRVLKGGWPFRPKSAPNTALLNYNPVSIADSLAVAVWEKNKIDLERGHVRLAKYYLRKKNYEQAIAEYKALTYLTPYNAYPYLKEANIYIKIKRFELAMPLLQYSLTLKETPFANKWIGQILLNDKNVSKSIPFLEKALKRLPSDPQLLFNLSGAYALEKNFKKAMDILNRLRNIYPNYPGEADLRNQIIRILSNNPTQERN